MSEKKLHRWALLDGTGNVRNYLDAQTRPQAVKAACRLIKRGALPKGWGLKKLEPTDLVSAPTPEPRAFRVGDRVRGKIGSYDQNPIMEGVVDEIDGDGDVHFKVKGDRTRRWAKAKNLTLLEPAPQPKAEEFKPGDPVRVVKGATAPIGTTGIVLGPGDNGGLNVRWNAGFGVRWAHPAQIERIPQNATPDPRDAEIATLKAEVERVRNEAREACEAMNDLARAKDAKLDGIKALLRAMKIMSQTPGDEPSFQDAMWHVVEN